MRITVVIPTYNEAENIGKLIDALETEFVKKPNHEFDILVVEGNSPDATAEVVKNKIVVHKNVHLLMEEKKAGLGAAYFYGFRYAMANLTPDVLVEMDADFQHDPKDITRLVEPLETGADYVIGSRYTKGGSIPKEWSFDRKILSIVGNLFSKIVLGIWSVNDFTTGYRASRVKGFVDRLDFNTILTKGYAYKLDILFKMHRFGAKVQEIPIAFGLRDRGISKMENNNMIDSLKVVLMLRVNENKNFFKFVIVGFTGLFVDGLLFNIFRLGVFPSKTAALVSGGIAMLVTFLLNNSWSFGERKLESVMSKFNGIITYFASSTIPIIIRSKLVFYATKNFGDTFFISNTAFFVGIVFGLVWNFSVYSKIIWKKKSK